MKGQVFIRREKILLRDSLTRAFLPVCTTLSTVFVDKNFKPFCERRACCKQAPVSWIFLARDAHLLEILCLAESAVAG